MNEEMEPPFEQTAPSTPPAPDAPPLPAVPAPPAPLAPPVEVPLPPAPPPPPPPSPGTTGWPSSPGPAPFSYPPALAPADPGPPDPVPARPPGRVRSWLPVALIAALVGALVGGGVTALADHTGNQNSPSVTIHVGNATPGAAVLSGNVTIPELVDKVIPAVVSIDVKAGGNEDQGTGMIITSDGEVMTNNHVIELYTQNGSKGSITVTESGQTKALPATLVGYDQSKDVALLKIDNASGLPTVTFGDSAKTVVGDAVVAIGNALGLAAGTPTVTQGIISALGRSVTAGGTGTATETLQNMIQTDAAINPGNSGGPLIDTSAQVIGMNTAVAGATSDGTSSQNIGFAIPAATIESLIPTLEKGGQIGSGSGYLGVDITTLTPALRQQYGFTPTEGVVILSVNAGSPAAAAGLVQGDVIVAVNGTTVTSADQLQKIIGDAKPGQQRHDHLLRGRLQANHHGHPGQPVPGPAVTGQRQHEPLRRRRVPRPRRHREYRQQRLSGPPPRRACAQSERAPGGTSKFRSGWAGGTFMAPPLGVQPLASMSSSTCAML